MLRKYTVSRTLSLLVWTVVVVSCRGRATEPLDVPPSPQAKAEPAPLANVSTLPAPSSSLGGVRTGKPPEALRNDHPIEGVDAPRDLGRDSSGKDASRDSREFSGYVLQATLRSGEGASTPKASEVNAPAIELIKRKLEPRLAITISQARARVVMSGAFVMPAGTELRSRSDRYGHIILWPGEDNYRVVEAGALRALFGERRLDVAPLSPAEVRVGGDGAHRLNFRTRRLDVSTRAAWATFELGLLRDSGDGGALVCRMLLELMSAPPSTAACGPDEVPLHAELHWTTQGGMSFDVVSIARRVDLTPQDLAVPPALAVFESSELPASHGESLASKSDLAAFRSGPVDVQIGQSRGVENSPNESGLTVVNSSDELRIAWLEAVPVAWVAPGSKLSLQSLQRGRYMFQWRTFLGDAWEPSASVVVPGTVEIGAADAAVR